MELRRDAVKQPLIFRSVLRKLNPTPVDPHSFDSDDSTVDKTRVDDGPILNCGIDNLAGGVVAETGNRLIELRIDREYDAFSDSDQRRLLAAIASLLSVSDEIKIISKRRGSVFLTIDLPFHQAEALYLLVNQGSLHEFGVSEAKLIADVPNELLEDNPAKLITPFRNRCEVAQAVAVELFHRRPSWVVFFREVLGVGGVLHKLFPIAEEMAKFERTSEYARIQSMVAELRANAKTPEATQIVTIRLPKSLYDCLKAEAIRMQTSMNSLCVNKLLYASVEALNVDGESSSSQSDIPF